MRLRYLLVATGVFALVAQVLAADCAEWDTPKFFEAATLAEVVECLEAGVDVNARYEYGHTPLHYAAQNTDNPGVITALLEAGAEVNARSENGSTPLHFAAGSTDNPTIIVVLVAAGAEVNARRGGELKLTPLHYAAWSTDNPDHHRSPGGSRGRGECSGCVRRYPAALGNRAERQPQASSQPW